MLFKDLKAGCSVYIFDRENVTFSQVRVLEVTPPHYDSHYGSPTEMVVDVSLEGFQRPYTFKDSTDTGYLNNLVISTDRNKGLGEVEALKAQAEQVLAKKASYETSVEKCSQILSEFSPVFKEKRENEARFSQLEGSVNELKSMISSLVKELKG